MQIRERVADSLIHVRGLWFRATRNAAYIRGIKEFVLEFCTVHRRRVRDEEEREEKEEEGRGRAAIII